VARLSEAIDALAAATEWMLAPAATERAALAVATPYLRLFGLASAGAFLAKGICSALRSNQNCADAIATTRFYAEHIATAAPGLSRTVVEGAEAVESMT
jgi:butyryl-CoA dehydrogenase